MVALAYAGKPGAAAAMAGDRLINAITIVGTVIAGAATVGSGAATVVGSIYSYQGTQSQIMAKEWGTLMDALKQYTKQTNKALQEIIQSISDRVDTAFKITQGMADSVSTTFSNIAHSA
jgi:hypothetical protein